MKLFFLALSLYLSTISFVSAVKFNVNNLTKEKDYQFTFKGGRAVSSESHPMTIKGLKTVYNKVQNLRFRLLLGHAETLTTEHRNKKAFYLKNSDNPHSNEEAILPKNGNLTSICSLTLFTSADVEETGDKLEPITTPQLLGIANLNFQKPLDLSLVTNLTVDFYGMKELPEYLRRKGNSYLENFVPLFEVRIQNENENRRVRYWLPEYPLDDKTVITDFLYQDCIVKIANFFENESNILNLRQVSRAFHSYFPKKPIHVSIEYDSSLNQRADYILLVYMYKGQYDTYYRERNIPQIEKEQQIKPASMINYKANILTSASELFFFFDIKLKNRRPLRFIKEINLGKANNKVNLRVVEKSKTQLYENPDLELTEASKSEIPDPMNLDTKIGTDSEMRDLAEGA